MGRRGPTAFLAPAPRAGSGGALVRSRRFGKENRGIVYEEDFQDRDPIHRRVKYIGAIAMVMSGPWSARVDRRNINRVGHRSRVAGAHLAPAGPHADNAGARLVFEPVPRRPVAIYLEPPGGPRSDGLNCPGRGPLGHAPSGLVGTSAFLDRQSSERKDVRNFGYSCLLRHSPIGNGGSRISKFAK